jgi:hypothetical protein
LIEDHPGRSIRLSSSPLHLWVRYENELL